MKMRNWTLLILTGLVFAWAASAFAATPTADQNRVVRSPAHRGAILEVTLLDTKGTPVNGAKVSATTDDNREVSALTGPDGVAVLDGLPLQSKGVVEHVTKKTLRAVNWDIRLESGVINYLTVRHNLLCYGDYPRKYTQPLVVKLPIHKPRFEQRWAPVSFVGRELPLKGDKFLGEDTQQLTYHPARGTKGQVTQAYFRPWGPREGEAQNNIEPTNDKYPVVPYWHISVYSVVNCDRQRAPEGQQ